MKDLTTEEREQVFQNNEKFREVVYDTCYQTLNFMTDDLNSILFVEPTRSRGYRYYDNYNSFYYRLTDAEEFVKGLKDGIGDYFSESDRPEYEKMLKLAEKYWNLEADDLYGEKGDKIYEKLEESAKKVLQAIEDMFHGYEEPTDDIIESELEYICGEDEVISEYTIDDDGTIHTGKEIVWR